MGKNVAAWMLGVAILGLSFLSSPAYAEELSVPAQALIEDQPPIELEWTDAKGDSVTPWQYLWRWQWKELKKKGSAKGPKRRPQLRIWLQLPPGRSIGSVKGLRAPLERNPKDSPFDATATTADAVAMLIDFPNIDVAMSLKKGAATELVKLKIRTPEKRPFFFYDPTCAEQRVVLTTNTVKEIESLSPPLDEKAAAKQAKAPPKLPARTPEQEATHHQQLFAGIVCEPYGSAVDVYLIHPKWTTVTQTTQQRAVEKGKEYVRYILPVDPRLETGSARYLAHFTVAHKKYDPTAGISIKRFPTFPDMEPKLKVTATFGLNQIFYNEDGDVRAQDIGARAGLMVRYWLSRDSIALHASGGMSVNVVHSPSSLESAKYFQLEGHATYYFSKKNWDAPMIGVGAGYFVWGMMVPSASYGVQNIGGPQVLGKVHFRKDGARATDLYLRLAPIYGAEELLNFGNVEFGAGASLQLSNHRTERPLELIFDLARTNYKDSVNRMDSLAFRLSLGVPLL